MVECAEFGGARREVTEGRMKRGWRGREREWLDDGEVGRASERGRES